MITAGLTIFRMISAFLVLVGLSSVAYFPKWSCPGEEISNWIMMLQPFLILMGSFLLGFVMSHFILRKSQIRSLFKVPAYFGLTLLFSAGFTMSSAMVTHSARQWALNRIMENAEPVILALQEFKMKKGSWPSNLSVLGMSENHTGVCGFQNFSYKNFERDTDPKRSSENEEPEAESRSASPEDSMAGGYELVVAMSTGFLNWDVFVFWPSRSYPNQMKGGIVEKVGDWAYVNE